MKRFDYHQPESLREAYGLMEKLQGTAKYIAGGTDVLVRIKQRAIRPDALISLRGIDTLTGISQNGSLCLGSMTRFRDVERDATLAREYPALAEAASWLANPQVRNVATVGGNICNAAPSADAAPPLLVLGAVLTVEGPGGKRDIPVERFFVGPGRTCLDPTEVLTGISIPVRTPGISSAFVKLGRVSQDIAVVNAAAMVHMEKGVCRQCRLAVGAVAPVPLRLRKVEPMLEGRRVEPGLLEQVSKEVEQEVKPITDVRSTEAYRRVVSGVLIKRAIQRAVERASAGE